MNLSINLTDLILTEKKHIYLIFFLPVSLIVGSTMANATIILIIFFFLLDCKKENNFFFLKDNNFYFLVCFNIYLILNSLLTGINFDGLVRSIGFFRFILLAFAILYYLSINNNKYEKSILKFWTIVFIIISIDLVFEYIFGYNLVGFKSGYHSRLAGFTGDELKIGGFYFGFILLISYFIKNQNPKICYIIIIAFIIISYLIGERSNFIKVLFICSIFFFFVNKIPFYKKFFYSIVFVLFSSIIIYSNNVWYEDFKIRFIDKAINFTKSIIKPPVKGVDYTDPKNVFDMHGCHYFTALEIFKKKPIIGAGVKKFRYESHSQTKYENFICGSTHPHQIHFELLSELGIVGYLSLMGYLIYFIYKSIKKFNIKKDYYAFAGTLFLLATILPILPSGSFFTTYSATFFWINYSFALRNFFTFEK